MIHIQIVNDLKDVVRDHWQTANVRITDNRVNTIF